MTTIKEYVALASEKALSVQNVQDGFKMLIPKKLKVDFLKQMEKDGWISSAKIPGNPKESEMADNYIMIHLVLRQKFIFKDGGRYCYVYDKITNKSSCVAYVMDF